MSQAEFVQNDNSKRVGAYKKNASIEARIEQMNDLLCIDEQYSPSGVERPTIFIFGLPRSGTSLMYQLLAKHLDIGYVNNLVARFWKAPIYGINLSQAVLSAGEPDIRLQSDYGKSSGLVGPHEFAYFWQNHLKVSQIDDMLKFNQENAAIDWLALGNIIRCMQDSFDKGLVFKTMYAANHIKEFTDTFPMPFFVYIERDPTDVALSILQAREAYYGDVNEWWATYPPEYHEIKNLPYAEQIAAQVRYLKEAYDHALSLLDSSLYFRTSYKALCADPAGFIETLRKKIQDTHGHTLNLRSETSLPSNLTKRTKDHLKGPQILAVRDAVKAIGLAE